MQFKKYKILKNNKIIESTVSGTFAGYKKGKIFGRLDCKSGMRMKKENRVFFHNLEDAVKQGYRPCNNCRPIHLPEFEKIKRLIPYQNINNIKDFYRLKLKG